MGYVKSAVLACCLIGLICIHSPAQAVTFTEFKNKIVPQVKLDAQWIDSRAKEVVDLIFVVDKSGSVSPTQLGQAKLFMKDFLDYFSIAPQHAQVGIVLFDSGVKTAIPLRHDDHKCKFMGELGKVSQVTGGGTNANAGLGTALTMLRTNSRRVTAKSLPVVVFITDGDYNNGGNPIGNVNALKAEGTLLIVITIGTNIRRRAEMLSWASLDVRKKPMAFPLENFKMFAELANYIHRGTHASKFLPIGNADCGNRCTGPAKCFCDTLASRGKPACGCESGFFVLPTGGKESCKQCPLGQYQEEKNMYRQCKNCPNGQTTHAIKSESITQCVCKAGFWNAQDHSSRPLNGQCTLVTCDRDSIKTLDDHSIALDGTCPYLYGKTCNYKCLRGFLTGGITVRDCKQDGRMHPPTAMCTPLQCPIVTVVPNSEGWKCVNQGRPQSGSYPYRTNCQNRCMKGYIPRHGTNEFMICGLDQAKKNGKWSGTSLVCEPMTCTNLPTVLNGQYNQKECAHKASTRTFGRKCSVTCNHGYQISEKVEWVCGTDGQWSNAAKSVSCKDIRAPEILTCPQHITLNNEEKQGYAIVQLKPLEAFDNDKDTKIAQTMNLQLSGASKFTSYQCKKGICGQTSFQFPIGTSIIKFTVTDRSGNSDSSCVFHVTVKDIEPPTVVKCDGPKVDKDGFIFSDKDMATVTWEEPEFIDNSGKKLDIYSTGSPGEYRVGRTWSFIYTAKDAAGNTAKCEFSFKLTGIRCPELHRPANGALVCDKLAFGIYCVPQCQKGLQRLLPDHIVRTPADYFCSIKGEWRPHADVGDCVIKTPINEDTLAEFEFTWFDGNCQDEHTKQSIIQNTLDALKNGGPSFTGQGFKDSQNRPLTIDDFEVFCGPKNESIVHVGGGGRFRRDAGGWNPSFSEIFSSMFGN